MVTLAVLLVGFLPFIGAALFGAGLATTASLASMVEGGTVAATEGAAEGAVEGAAEGAAVGGEANGLSTLSRTGATAASSEDESFAGSDVASDIGMGSPSEAGSVEGSEAGSAENSGAGGIASNPSGQTPGNGGGTQASFSTRVQQLNKDAQEKAKYKDKIKKGLGSGVPGKTSSAFTGISAGVAINIDDNP